MLPKGYSCAAGVSCLLTLFGLGPGFPSLFWKESRRFLRVVGQTVGAPVLAAFMYLLVFSHLFDGRPGPAPGVSYVFFLTPGLVMMSMLQNAFANTSSSLIQSKVTGALVFVLLAPISSWDFFAAYVSAAVLRGLIVGLGVFVATLLFAPGVFFSVGWVLLFAFLGTGLLGALGLVVGVLAEKFEQIAVFQNFIIVPLTFLSGVFYPVKSLPYFWMLVSHLNPFFYVVDGFRYGFIGVSDASPWLGLMILLVFSAFVTGFSLWLLSTGRGLRR